MHNILFFETRKNQWPKQVLPVYMCILSCIPSASQYIYIFFSFWYIETYKHTNMCKCELSVLAIQPAQNVMRVILFFPHLLWYIIYIFNNMRRYLKRTWQKWSAFEMWMYAVCESVCVPFHLHFVHSLFSAFFIL